MDIPRLLTQIVVAIACAGIATLLIPRRVPGQLAGLILLGMGGVWLGEWGFALLRQTYGLSYPWLSWRFQGVALIPAIVGSMILLYVVTTVLGWGRYRS